MAADSGMETCPSPEIADSRKRPLDCDAENGATKRSHYGTGNFLNYFFLYFTNHSYFNIICPYQWLPKCIVYLSDKRLLGLNIHIYVWMCMCMCMYLFVGHVTTPSIAISLVCYVARESSMFNSDAIDNWIVLYPRWQKAAPVPAPATAMACSSYIIYYLTIKFSVLSRVWHFLEVIPLTC